VKTCPICGCEQSEGLLCHAETSLLERDLGDVAAIVAELDVSLSKMARIGTPSKGGLARERMPYNQGASIAAGALENTLTTWVRDLTSDQWRPGLGHNASTAAAAHMLMLIPEIRRHPAVDELVDQVADAVRQARHAVDRPADRQYLGQCLVPSPDEEGREVTCLADVYAKPTASQAKCICGVTHDVTERRDWLLRQAGDRLFSVKEAAQLVGSYGDLRITESTIRNYVSTGQLGYHGKVAGSSVIRLGDLLEVIATHAAKPRGRKLKRAS
jgi:hypothetical protein